MNRHEGLRAAVLACLADGPKTVADIWQHCLDADIDCTEDTIRRNLRYLQYRTLVERGDDTQPPHEWALTGDGAETAEILRVASGVAS